MITIKSNIDSIIKSYEKKVLAMKELPKIIANKIALMARDDMLNEIATKGTIWREVNGKISRLSGTDIVVETNATSSMVIIGRNTKPYQMKDKVKVNPYFFIEFGFGIIGGDNQADNSTKYGWSYNINNYEKKWYFKGLDRTATSSQGQQGINFLYNTVEKYKTKWITVAAEEMRKVGLIND